MKIFASLLSALALCLLPILPVQAESEATAFVTLSDSNGTFLLTHAAVSVTDNDQDGKLTLNDALYAAHAVYYPNGVEAGYGSYPSEFGISLSKLWGDESGAFGYRINDAEAFSLDTEIQNNDHIKAYIYQDQASWSDSYAWFTASGTDLRQGEMLTLTLQSAGYDAEWKPITAPVANAVITINGTPTEYRTDANGTVSFPISSTGTLLIGATCDTQVIVPPLCVVHADPIETQGESSLVTTGVPTAPETGCTSLLSASLSFGLLAFAIFGLCLCRKKQNHV